MEIGRNLPVLAPGVDRETYFACCQRIDSGPFASVATPQALRGALQQAEDAGADDARLAPTTSDPDDVHRVADIIG